MFFNRKKNKLPSSPYEIVSNFNKTLKESGLSDYYERKDLIRNAIKNNKELFYDVWTRAYIAALDRDNPKAIADKAVDDFRKSFAYDEITNPIRKHIKNLKKVKIND